MMNDDPLLDTDEASHYLHRPSATLRNWRWSGQGPAFVKMGRQVFYRRSDLNAFIERSIRRPPGAADPELPGRA